MKRRNVGLLVASVMMNVAISALSQEKNDTLVIVHPDKVMIETSTGEMSVKIEGREGNPDFRYVRKVALTTDELVVTKERSSDWDFNIPFMNKKKVMKSRNQCRLEAFGIGLVTAIDAPEGMNIDMGSSYELMGPTLEWRHYPGNSGLSFSWGVGVNWKNYRMTGMTRFVKQDNRVVLADYPEGADVKFSRLKVFSWTMPFMLNYDITRKIEVRFGPVVNFNTYASLKTRYTLNGEKIKETAKDIHQNRVTVDLMAMFSVGSIGIYAKYAPCKVLNSEFGPDFRGFSAGMTLWW